MDSRSSNCRDDAVQGLKGSRGHQADTPAKADALFFVKDIATYA